MPPRLSPAPIHLDLTIDHPQKPNGPGPVLRWMVLVGLVVIGCFLGIILQVKIYHPFDKLAHIAFFCAISAAFYFVMPRRKILIFGLVIALAAMSEFAQSLTIFRVASLADFAADLIGVGLFFSWVYWLNRPKPVQKLY